MTSSTDHISGVDGLAVSMSLSKNGGTFSLIASPDIIGVGYGWYSINLDSSNTDTLGDLVIHLTATGADPSDILMSVVEYTTDDVALMVNELHTIQGLKSSSPSTTTPTTWVAGGISISISGDGETSTTMTRL